MNRILAGFGLWFLLAAIANAQDDIEAAFTLTENAGYTALTANQYEQAMIAFQRGLELKPGSALSAYNIACTYARQGNAKLAADWLQRAVAWGYYDFKHMEVDSDLDSLRAAPHYTGLIGQLRQQAQGGAVRGETPALARALQLVVMLEGDMGEGGAAAQTYGAGILFGYDGNTAYIATANHVVRQSHDAHDIKVLLRNAPDRWVSARLMPMFDPKIDLAVLSIASREIPGKGFCSLPLSSLGSSQDLQRGDPVFPVGNPNAHWGMPIEPDRIAQIAGTDVNFQSTFIAKGDSGGALFTDEGVLIGILRADEPPYGVAVGISRVLLALQQWKLPVQLRSIPEPVTTPLHQAAERGAVEDMGQLLKNCADVNAADSTGRTPLHAAADHNMGPAAKLLLESGAEKYVWMASDHQQFIDERSRTWKSPLHVAAEQGSIDVVKELLSAGVNPNVSSVLSLEVRTKNDRGQYEAWRQKEFYYPSTTPLHLAVARPNLEVISMLVKAGANPNALDDDDASPLSDAIDGGQAKNVELLLQLGASPDLGPEVHKNRDGPLQQAVRANRADIAQLLINGNANLNAKTGLRTPLGVAVELNLYEIAQRLRQAGAKTGAEDLDQAIRDSHVDMVKLLAHENPELNAPSRGGGEDNPLSLAAETGQMDMVQVLLAAGADINGAPGKGELTPLDVAIKSDKGDVEELLIARGASLGQKTPERIDFANSVLGPAVRERRVNVVRKLLALGADPNSNYSGGNPLIVDAIEGGNIELVRMLLDAGADPNASYYDGPLALAQRKGNPDIVALVKKAGGKSQ